ncbi:MAG: M13 family metallopeptidase [Alphaproteobacteria bacterium]
MNRRTAVIAAFALMCGAVGPIGAAAAGAKKAVYGAWGVDLSMMDKSVKPGDDFFAYSNGGWLKTAEIPADRSYAGVNLELNTRNENHLKEIMADLAKRGSSSLSADERKVRDMFAAYTDETGREARGLEPARGDLARIAAAQTKDDIARLMGDIALQLDGPFGAYIGSDDKNPTAYAVFFYQSGLGLPDRDYYLRNDKEIVETLAAYRKYLAAMLDLAGLADTGKRANAVLALETEIARAHWPAADRRDADKVYNPMTIGDLEKFAPEFPWRVAFEKAGIPVKGPKGDRTFIIAEKSAFPKLAKIFAKTPVAVWRDYLTQRYMRAFAAELPKKVDETNFAFYGTVLNGNPKQLDRTTRAIYVVDNTLGEALGKIYVERYFPPDAKAKSDLLVQYLFKAYEADIKTLPWMGDATRAKALAKLGTIIQKIGYPDKWRDYSAMQVSPTDAVANSKAASIFEWNRRLSRIDETVDKMEWGMTPPTNNAYYNPTTNEIAFPAGILQPPFFDPNADDAVNYGEIGATIGHEISHGFDDQGSKYDASGKLENWWTEEDRKNFDARTQALSDQFDQYEPLPGIHINGKLTLGENIADLAGLVIALKAYHLSLKGKKAPVIDGFTGDQRFYIAYAQSWREKHREGRLRAQLLSNPHSPAEYRVSGIVRNDDGWYAAFPEIKPGDKLYLAPEKRVRLW